MTNDLIGIQYGYLLKKNIPPELRRRIFMEGLWEDLQQQINLSAIEASLKFKKLDRDCLRFLSRNLYSFLKQNGYHRSRSANMRYVKDTELHIQKLNGEKK